MNIDICFIDDVKLKELNIVNNKIEINMLNSPITLIVHKIENYLKIFNNIESVQITFSKEYNVKLINRIVIKLDNILYSSYPNKIKIKYTNISDETKHLVDELEIYKNIIMETNKTPATYLEYIKKHLPRGYKMKVFTIKDNNKMFPLTAAVGKGSSFNSYFVHIYPTKNSKNTYILIGKAVTYDSGGLNLKMQKMEEMKTDMTGSAILLSVLKLLNKNEHDNDSIHLLFPIVENMIGNNAIRPGVVVASLNNITVEITNTDAEGRLCIADALEYFTNYIKPKVDIKNTVLLDIATLTGNVENITGGLGGIIFCNNKGLVIKDKLIKIGNNIGEYLDFLHIRDEYKEFLKSSVADISNHNKDFKGGSVYAATFLNHFCDETIPWIHIDIGCTSFHNNCANSYGIYLLYQFIKKLN